MFLGYGFSALALIIMLRIFYHYHIAFRQASISLFNLHCNYETFEARHNFSRLFMRIANSHLNIYLFLTLIYTSIFLYLANIISRLF